MHCLHVTTASRHAYLAGTPGSSYLARQHSVTQLVPRGGLHSHRLRILTRWKPALRRFYAARPALRGCRCLGELSASVARFPIILVFPLAKGYDLLPVYAYASGCARYNSQRSRGLRLDPDAETTIPRSLFSDFLLSLQEEVLYVVTRCLHAAPWRLKTFFRTTGKNASNILFSAPACFEHTSCNAGFLLQDSRLSRLKTSLELCLRRPRAASALIQGVLLEKDIRRSTFTNRPCRPDLTFVRALSYLFLLRAGVGCGKLCLFPFYFDCPTVVRL